MVVTACPAECNQGNPKGDDHLATDAAYGTTTTRGAEDGPVPQALVAATVNA